MKETFSAKKISVLASLFLLKIPFLSALLFNAAEQQCRLAHKWSCGATSSAYQLSLTEQLSCQLASAVCPKTRSAINECCIEHDACYERRLGQGACDDAFCQCLSCVTPCDGPLCELKVGRGFCFAVRAFGAFIYNSAGSG